MSVHVKKKKTEDSFCSSDLPAGLPLPFIRMVEGTVRIKNNLKL